MPVSSPAQPRRDQIVAGTVEATGIDEAMIERLVRRFYEKVRTDSILGPVFEARITDWEPHLQKMFAFWSSVALMSGRYHGQPMARHATLPVDAGHFDRWLGLFTETAEEVCPGAAAELFIARARRIASSLELGLAATRGVMLGKGERLGAPGGAAGSDRAARPQRARTIIEPDV